MFVGRECSSVDVQVGVDFDRRNVQSTAFQQRSNAARNNSLSNPANNATSHQNVLHVLALDRDVQFNVLVSYKNGKHRAEIKLNILEIVEVNGASLSPRTALANFLHVLFLSKCIASHWSMISQ